MKLFLDIETIPTQQEALQSMIREDLESERDKQLAAVKAPANYKDVEKIDAFIAQAKQQIFDQHEANVQSAIERTSFDGGLGQIVCIAYAIDDQDTVCLSATDLTMQSEASLLELFWQRMLQAHTGTSGMRPMVIGHNHLSFDLPFLWHRSIIHQIPPPSWFPRNPKPWSEGVADTMLMWAGDKNRISMDRLCKLLGLEGKGSFSGADVWPAVRDGKLDEVVKYCADDVRRTRALYKRMTFVTQLLPYGSVLRM